MLIEYNGNHPVGQNILRLRKKYCLSRRALAKLLGVNEITLRELERGTSLPVIADTTLCRLCQIFAVEPEELVAPKA